MVIPTKILERLTTGIKRFQNVLASAKSRDVGEADTSTIVKDILCEVFGYDKYNEITAEYLIKGTYCDLAIKIEGKIRILIEVKSIGLELKDNHLKQAVDYGVNQGVEWVILTNGMIWQVHNIVYGQPVGNELLAQWDFSNISSKSSSTLELLYLISKEAQAKSLLEDYHQQKQAMNRFTISAVLQSEQMIDVLRREMRKLAPGVKIDNEDLIDILRHEVLKREVQEGDRAIDAIKKVKKILSKTVTKKVETKKGTDVEADIKDA